ncbi:hypothetical protein MLOOGBEN_27430 [Bacillus sp. EB106-08-02-XG196]|jgi:hypothetical protein|uniref:hypothetical protein n=1 Tax=Bacillus sp. EB106-08-02-XG196 TaxID=2737049 RepID=UPI0015C491EE|nr:hypothetical protein [Bacillus sp. EB106-08-02-XG196]NWQ44425.1 hypothetical protein [Bacillus sp. EB106-08-02-XG196]
MSKEVCRLLTTTLTFHIEVDFAKYDLPFLKKRSDSHYEIYLDNSDKALGDVHIAKNGVKLEYSSELLLEEYIIIHDLISRLREGNDVVVDDSKSFLGYLSDGEPAYMIKNWEPWIEYLQSSMKNCL